LTETRIGGAHQLSHRAGHLTERLLPTALSLNPILFEKKKYTVSFLRFLSQSKRILCFLFQLDSGVAMAAVSFSQLLNGERAVVTLFIVIVLFSLPLSLLLHGVALSLLALFALSVEVRVETSTSLSQFKTRYFLPLGFPASFNLRS
jgi:hypothetical protein